MHHTRTSSLDNGSTVTASLSPRYLRPVLFVAGASALVLALATLSKPLFYVVFTHDIYLPVHSLTETASVVVSFSIFAINWNAADKARDTRALVIGTAFLAVAIIDTLHVLSFPGMPEFVTPSSVGKGIQYWLSARIWAAVVLVGAAFVGQSTGSRFLRRAPLLILNLAVAFAAFVAVSFFADYLPPLYDADHGLTPLKIGLEYLVAAISAVGALAYLKSFVDSGNPFPRLLAMALIVTVFSELSFTLYASAYDTYNLLGHLYKVVAYYFIFTALFVSAVQRPYAELERLYDQIDNRLQRTISDLRARATELDVANKELETFSYTVSHDLRAPLRSIDGFSRILLEDYADKLDEQGKDYLQHVINSSRHMAHLIEGILTLARASRVEMHREEVNLSALAQEIATGLRGVQSERRGEFVIAEGVTATADSRLMRAVLENLLGNAWKFTEKHPTARIEFGVTQRDGEKAYYVSDDGAGFDMAYADKLFAPFQRLHSVEEFSGSGIGLSTVQRIVQRHGGRIWAEGAVGKGATFYFTLG